MGTVLGHYATKKEACQALADRFEADSTEIGKCPGYTPDTKKGCQPVVPLPDGLGN